jgi:hypothetical protein
MIGAGFLACMNHLLSVGVSARESFSLRLGVSVSLVDSPGALITRQQLGYTGSHAASKCPPLSGLRGSPRRTAVSRLHIGNVCADYPMGPGTGAAHAFTSGALVVAGGDLSCADRSGEPSLENESIAEGWRARRCRARCDRLVHAASITTQTIVTYLSPLLRDSRALVVRPQPYSKITRAAESTHAHECVTQYHECARIAVTHQDV